MASHWLSRAALVLAAGALAATAALGTGPALAAPAESPSIASVKEQVAALRVQVQSATEKHEQAQQDVANREAELFEIQRETAATQARLTSSTRALGQMAAAAYRAGTIDPGMLQVIFADRPEDALHQAASYTRVLEEQDRAVTRVAEIKDELVRDQKALAVRLAELEENRDTIARERAAIEQKTAEAERLLATLEEEERRRIAEEAARAAAAREAERASRSSSRQSLASPSPSTPRSSGAARTTAAGSCPPSGSRGAESGLTPATLSIMRCGLAAFPQVDRALGVGNRGNATDHDNGRAVDFMIPGYRSAGGNDLGWRIAEWATKQPNVEYVIFDQMIFGSWNGSWRPMGNRGSDTANHRDHVHVSVGR